MGIVEFIQKFNLFDLAVLLALLGGFLLGYLQGAIRRLLGILAMVVSFALAASMQDSVGEFLSRYWTQYPLAYTDMLAFGGLFITFLIAGTIIIQVFYKRMPLFARYEALDEVIGGLLGIVEVLLFISFGIIILDSYFALAPADTSELRLLRDLYDAINASQTASLFRDTLIPIVVTVFGIFLPADVKSLY